MIRIAKREEYDGATIEYDGVKLGDHVCYDAKRRCIVAPFGYPTHIIVKETARYFYLKPVRRRK